MRSNSKLIVKNSIYLLSRTIFLILINLFALKEVLKILGAEAFGLFNLIFGVVALFAFVNGALTSATQRFISFEIGTFNNKGIVNSIFACLFIHCLIATIIMLVLFIVKDYILEEFLSIAGYKKEANYLYYFACINIFISFIQSVFIALITSFEKMKLFSYISIFEAILKLSTVYILYLNLYNSVISYGFLLSLASLIVLFIYILFSYKIIVNNSINFKFEIRTIIPYVSSIRGFIGWSLIGNLAWVCKNQGSNVLLNIYFGVLLNAAYALSLALTSLVNNLLSSVSNAIKPQIFKSYSTGNKENFYSLIINGTKYYIYFLTLITVPLIFFMDIVLALWLNDIPKYAVEFSILTMILVLVESYSVLLITAVQATGKIAINQLVVGGILLMNIPISLCLLEYNNNPYIVFYVAIFLSVIALFLKIIITNKVSGLNISQFVKSVIIPCNLYTLLIGILFYSTRIISEGYDTYMIIMVLIFSYIFAILIFYSLFLSNTEKSALNYRISKYLKGG